MCTTRQHFNEAYANEYSSPCGYVNNVVNILNCFSPDKPTGLFLDVGIGSGEITREFNRHNPNWLGYGIDCADEGLRQCIKSGIPKTALRYVDLEKQKMPFPENTFDFVFCTATLTYLNNACTVIANMIHVTKPGGRLVLGADISHTKQVICTDWFPGKKSYAIRIYASPRTDLEKSFKDTATHVIHPTIITSNEHRDYTLFVLEKC